MAKEPTNADAGKENKGPEWGGFKGKIVAGSLVEADGKLTAKAVTAEGKEHTLVAYPHMKNGAAALREAAESGAERVFRGPMLGSSNKGTFHFGAAIVKEPGVKAAEMTAEEAAAKAADKEAAKAARGAAASVAAGEKDASRVLVAAEGSADRKTVEVNGVEVAVSRVSRAFDLDAKAVERIAQTWPDHGFAAGDKVAYAEFDRAELDAKLADGVHSPAM